jgi:endonuclease/exonuclease/phosphatase (EEP) superfamily protein YafD
MSLAAFLGRWIWWLDVLANFRAQYVVGLAVLGLIVVLSRWRKTGYAVLGVALVNLLVVLPLYLGSPAKATVEASAIRVMSFNLLSTNERYTEVIEYIEGVDPDLILLHEASRPWEVAMEAAELDYQIIRPRSEDLIFGTLVLVKGDAVEAVSYGFAASSARAVELTYTPEGWTTTLSILGTHPLAPQTASAPICVMPNWVSPESGHPIETERLSSSGTSTPPHGRGHSGD